MKAPIIADNHGDVLLFETIAKTESYMEPVDILNGEYSVYDAEGYMLVPSIYKDKKGRERVAITMAEPLCQRETELKNVLIGFISKVTESQQSLTTTPLEKLIDIGMQFGKTE